MLASAAAPLLAALLGPAPPEPILSYAPSPATLGETAAVRIRVLVPDAAADAPAPRLRTTEGKLSGVERVGAGEWAATLSLPRGGPPFLAIVSAVREEPGASPAAAFLAIPVRGRAAVPVETEPGARVWVSAGAEEVGPVAAGPRGRATISVAVPPGARQATVRASGAGGRTERTVDLDVPPPNRIAMAATPAGDRLARIDIYVAGDGEVDLTAAGARATVPEPVAGRPGRFTAMVSGRPGPVTVRAGIRGDPASRASAEVALPGAAGAPRRPSPGPAPPGPPPPPPEEAAAPPEGPPPPPAPVRSLSSALGVRARPGGPAAGEARVGGSLRLAGGTGLSAGASASAWLSSGEQPPAPLPATRIRAREAGLLPEAYGRLELPGLFLQAAVGPAVSLACAAAEGSSMSCSAALSLSFRAGAGFRLPSGEDGREVALTAEWGIRHPVAGGGLARESGVLGGMGVLLGVSVGAR